MTLDEAIEFCKEKSRNIKLRTEPKTFEQIAEWLEELKEYEMALVCNGMQLYHEQGYNKAIDDFKKELFKNSERVRPVGWLGYSEVVTREKIYDIAEQLKGGDGE